MFRQAHCGVYTESRRWTSIRIIRVLDAATDTITETDNSATQPVRTINWRVTQTVTPQHTMIDNQLNRSAELIRLILSKYQLHRKYTSLRGSNYLFTPRTFSVPYRPFWRIYVAFSECFSYICLIDLVFENDKTYTQVQDCAHVAYSCGISYLPYIPALCQVDSFKRRKWSFHSSNAFYFKLH